MPTCQGKLSEGEPCPEIVEDGKLFCRWHDPEDKSWKGIYKQLERASPEERAIIVLKLVEEHPDHRLELPKREGKGVTLEFIDLSRETLRRKKYSSSSLRYANLQEADLMNANLQGADLWGVNFQGANLYGANLQEAAPWGANLQKADLLEANLQKAFLQDAKLQEADLWRANLQETNLMGANLSKTNLRNAKLQNVDFTSVKDLSNVYISDAWFDRTRLRKDQLGGAIGEELDGNYSAAKRGYLALKQNFDDLGDYDASSWAYRKERRMEKLEARKKGWIALTGRESDDEGYISTFTLNVNGEKY